MMTILFIVFFSIMVAVKGGLLGYIPGLKEFAKKNIVLDWLLDGNVISAILSGIFIGFFAGWLVGLLFAAAWFLAWAPSVGEEIGAIGRFGHNWGDYVEWLGSTKARKMGWKKGLQRGVFLGACLSLAMYSIPGNEFIIIACALFPALYFLGNEIYYRVHKTDSWFYAEFIMGGVIGAALSQLF